MLSTVMDVVAAMVSVAGMALLLAAAYFLGGGVSNSVLSAVAGVVLLATGMTTLVRRDTALSNRIVDTLKELFDAV
jgi:hypothetical protein